MVSSFFEKLCYLIPLTEVEVRLFHNNIILYMDEESKKLGMAIPSLEKYGFGNMEGAYCANRRWFLYPSDEKSLRLVADDRPIFRLDFDENDNLEVTSVGCNTDFVTSITNFLSGDNKDSTNNKKVKKIGNIIPV